MEQKGFSYWDCSSSQTQMENFPLTEEGDSIGVNPLSNLLDLSSFDAFAEFCGTPSSADQGLPMTDSFTSFSALNFAGQSNFYHPMDSQIGFPVNSRGGEDSGVNGSDGVFANVENGFIPRSLGLSLNDKMLKAMSLFKESSGGGILAQVWVPVKHGNEFFLSTREQPYLLDQMLVGYREVSRAFTFSAKEMPGFLPGLPGRVFRSKMPEWTSNVVYYSKDEYLRVDYAIDHQVRGSLALPIFNPQDESCCAVLELVTVKEKCNFNPEIENVCRALQAVNLRTIEPARLSPQSLSTAQRAALAEIVDVLRAACHAHRLPLALTWIPCSFPNGISNDYARMLVKDDKTNSGEKSILCAEETACYVNNTEMQGFVSACVEHYLERGQGIAGKALQSNHPFFSSDVKGFDIKEYPLVHHARKFGLNAAVAIRLRSTYTGNNDYILEFFLPVNCKGSLEQQLLLNSLSSTMQRICKSLRTVSGAELIEAKETVAGIMKEEATSLPSKVEPSLSDSKLDSDGRVANSDVPQVQRTSSFKRQPDKKRSMAEKSIGLNVLQQYFSGSLKDAAKSIGVCPTTLKRICRQHGISRWPSRKINKVNRSLKKIQTVIDSVQGVEGGLKFDPISGGLVAASMVQDFDAHSNIFSPRINPSSSRLTSQDVISVHSVHEIEGESSAMKIDSETGSVGNSHFSNTCNNGEIKNIKTSQGETTSWACARNVSGDPYLTKERCNKWGSNLESPDSSSSMLDSRMEGEGVVDQNQLTSSGMTDSSDGSASIMNGSCEVQKCVGENGSTITVKANYNDDTVRFKFEPDAGCFHLFEEVGKRFNLSTGTFQLKYLDDEDEWVLLMTESDLQECLEILGSIGMRSVKLMVRDLPHLMGSSTSSNGFLTRVA